MSTDAQVADLTLLVRRIIELVGRRADNAAVVEFVTVVLNMQLPASTTEVNNIKYVTAPQKGVNLAFSHDIKNEKYPPVRKSKGSYLPYLYVAWLTEQFPEPLPFGLRIGMSPDERTRQLGVAPREVGGARRPVWERVLDAARDIQLLVDNKVIAIQVAAAQALTSAAGVPSRAVVGLFVAWAAQRGLLDETRLANHAELIAAICRRERPGSELVDKALLRGLWDVHLRDEPGLRAFALAWFLRFGDTFIRDDMVELFGSRMGPYGHIEPALDTDDWANVDRATPLLDSRFAAWIKPGS